MLDDQELLMSIGSIKKIEEAIREGLERMRICN
jgi:hypothetical protein